MIEASHIKQILAFLSKEKDEKGVVSNRDVISPADNNLEKVLKPSPTLSADEKLRYTNIFKIAKDVLFPSDEAKRLESTKIGKITKSDKATSDSQASKKSIPWNLLASIGIAAAAAMLFDKLGPMGVFLTKAIGKVKAIFEIIKRTFTTISSALDSLKKAKWATGINEWLGKIKAFPMKVFSKIKEVVSGSKIIASFLEGFGSAAKVGGDILKGVKAVGGTFIAMMKNVLKGVGGKLLKTLKFLPFIGGIVGLGFAYARYKKGDWIAGTFELISAILDFTGVGSIASVLIDGGLLFYDMWQAKNEKLKEEGKQEIGFLKYISNLVGDKLLPIIRYLPVIGGILELGDSYSAFKEGNIGDGLRFLGRGLLAFVGGKGLADTVSSGIGFISSMFSNKKEELKTSSLDEGKSWVDILKDVWGKVSTIVGEKIKAMKDWVMKKLDPRNWFNNNDAEQNIKRKATQLSDNEKLARARAAGWNSWDAYKKSNWEWKADTPVSKDTLQVSPELISIGKQQVILLKDISDGIKQLIRTPNTNIIANTPPQTTSRPLTIGSDFNTSIGALPQPI